MPFHSEARCTWTFLIRPRVPFGLRAALGRGLGFKRLVAQRELDSARGEAKAVTTRGLFTSTTRGPSTAKLQRVADRETRYERFLALERELGRYRPGWRARRGLRRGPVPARRPHALD